MLSVSTRHANTSEPWANPDCQVRTWRASIAVELEEAWLSPHVPEHPSPTVSEQARIVCSERHSASTRRDDASLSNESVRDTIFGGLHACTTHLERFCSLVRTQSAKSEMRKRGAHWLHRVTPMGRSPLMATPLSSAYLDASSSCNQDETRRETDKTHHNIVTTAVRILVVMFESSLKARNYDDPAL